MMMMLVYDYYIILYLRIDLNANVTSKARKY